MRRVTRIPLFGVLLGLGLSLGITGCSSKKKLDRAVDRLVNAALKDDYAAFRSMSRAELAAKFPQARFTVLSQALNSLGAYKERTMKSIKAKTGRVRKGEYELRFEKGKVKLEVTLVKSKLTGFLFSGDDLERAVRRVQHRKYETFKVAKVHWRDGQGKEKNNIYAMGLPVSFRVDVWGFKRVKGAIHVRADLKVTDGKTVLLTRPGFVNKPIAVPEEQPPTAILTGNLTPNRPGTFQLQLTIVDQLGNQTLTHTEAFVVSPK